MAKVDNSITIDKNYITKSKINRNYLRSIHIPDSVSIEEAKKCFDECEFKNVLVGNPYNKKMQRHTRYVYDYALYRQIIFGYSRKKKR